MHINQFKIIQLLPHKHLLQIYYLLQSMLPLFPLITTIEYRMYMEQKFPINLLSDVIDLRSYFYFQNSSF